MSPPTNNTAPQEPRGAASLPVATDNPDSTPRPYGTAAFRYRTAGWPGPIPVGSRRKPLDKDPVPAGFTGWENADRWPDDDQLAAWVRNRGNYNLALRLPRNVISLDVDAWKGDTYIDTMKAITKAHGKLPRTWVSTSRTDSSGNRLFRLPFDVAQGDLAHEIRHPTEDRSAGEVIVHGHRYLVVSPSIHPDTGEPYRWQHQETGEVLDGQVPKPSDLPLLPQGWIDHLRGDCSCFNKTEIRMKGDPVQAAFEKWHSRLTSGTKSRHDSARGGCMALVAFRHRGWPGADEYLRKLEEAFLAAVTADKSRTDSESRAEWKRMVDGAEAKAPSSEIPEWEDRSSTTRTNVTFDDCAIPDEVWDARPELDHIRRAAFSRGRSADAVLVAVLVRLAADTPHTVRLPAIVGSLCGLTTIGALTGPPGAGKSSGANLAKELVPATVLHLSCDGVSPGSGEGLIELLFDNVKEPDPDGKLITVHRQTKHNAFMFIDEGEVLAKLAGRQSGSTLLPNLRTAFTSGPLGQANASQDRKRLVPAGQAVYGVVLGIQPELAGPLFDEAGAGTPQRILWASVTTPTPPPGERPEWPGPLPRPSIPPSEWVEHEVRGGYVHHLLGIPKAVADEVAQRDHHRQQHGAPPLDEHQDLIQLKVAAVLAVMQGRLDLTIEDWQIASSICETSRKVRNRLAEHLRQHEAERETATSQRLARRQVEAAVRTAEWRTVETARTIAKRVRSEPGELTPGKLRSATSPSQRDVFEDAFEYAVTQGWIVEKEEPGQGTTKRRLHPGKRKP